MLRDVLNRHRWRDGDLSELELSVRHRGAPGDVRVIPGLAIADIVSTGVHLIREDDQPEGAFIPFHRVLRVDGPDGIVWVREGPRNVDP
ncbi:MAG: DUF504 domain-containing protein [Proteobacteria bacterium]|nr:DUF504 domain-containing protein [Pseudomonadota bacterium]